MTNLQSQLTYFLPKQVKLAIIVALTMYARLSFTQCCNYTLVMQDRYGDGWNGGTLQLFVNNTLKGTFNAQGFGSIMSFEVCNDDIISLVYTSGEYEEENIYQIYDAGWNIFFQDGPIPAVGNVMTKIVDCKDDAIVGKHPCIALPISLGLEVEGNNTDYVGSGIQAMNCPGFQGGDMWYRTEIPSSGNIEVSIHQRNDVTVGYAIWQGTECAGIRMLSCGSTDNSEKRSTLKVYDIAKGQKIFVQVWGANDDKTSFFISSKDLGRIILDGSDLPVFSINTQGQNIPYRDKVNVKLSVIENGQINYNGNVGINIRGASSSGYAQPPYSIETRDEAGENNNVPLLGMPEENDWVLISNFNDRSLIRNTLAHHLFNKMGNYSPKTRLCEVLIDSSYKGIYVSAEKIKRDKNRVNIATLNPQDVTGDQLTGGYILEQNLRGDNNSFQSNYSPIDHPGLDVHFLYEYPDATIITSEQKRYIAGFIDSLESRLYSNQFNDTKEGYRRFLDVPSFIDYFLVNEVARNADGFKKSIFYNKDRFSKNNKLKAGPVWDFDWAWKNLGICHLYDNFSGFGWAHLNNDCGTDNNSSGWYVRMLQDTTFANELRCTYESYRKTMLDTVYLSNYIDSIHQLVMQAHVRHFDRWNILGVSGPAPEIGAIATTYAAELDTLKHWINTRIKWLDQNIPGNCSQISSAENVDLDSFALYPNPTSGLIHFKGKLASGKSHALHFYNSIGQPIDHVSIPSDTDDVAYRFDIKGLYYYTLTSDGIVKKSGKLIVL